MAFEAQQIVAAETQLSKWRWPMYTFHGWIVLSDSTYEGDDDVLFLRAGELRRNIQTWLDLASDPVVITNGLVVLHLSLCANRRLDYHEHLRSMLSWICEKLPGSYGHFYWADSDDPAIQNSFQVIVLARGTMSEVADPWLSPLNPAVED
jgi:hypothetical protein